jgi:hypothetical protein
MQLDRMFWIRLVRTEPQTLGKRLNPLFELSQKSLLTMQEGLSGDLSTIDLSRRVPSNFTQLNGRNLVCSVHKLVGVSFRYEFGRLINMDILIVNLYGKPQLGSPVALENIYTPPYPNAMLPRYGV